MKILTSAQIRALDAYNIEHEPITSVDLMERAATRFAEEVMARWDKSVPVRVFAGPGNNGGDALVVARLLANNGYKVWACLFNTSGTLSEDCQVNLGRLRCVPNVEIEEVSTTFAPPQLTKSDLVIDGLFGTGMSRPLNGGFASVVRYINASPATVVSIDVPSGLMCEDNSYNVMNHVIRADYTFTFQYPKLSFLFAENEQYVGEWKVLDIGLKDPDTEITETPYAMVEAEELAGWLKPRSRFVHKGTVGTAALVAGKKGMAGAAILAARACMKGGVGKLTIHTPEYNVPILQTSVPEAVLHIDRDNAVVTQVIDTTDFDAIAVGPGMGTEQATVQVFIEQVGQAKCPSVIDADALNILGSHRGWMSQLPRRSILTPHKKELFGLISSTRNSFEELERTRETAMRYHLFIVIKGAYSAIVTPEGTVCFNTTGNPGMATAGSGDVLTGLLLALLAQQYPQEQAVRLGVYLHGLAGDIAAERLCEESVTASDIVDAIPQAFNSLKALASK